MRRSAITALMLSASALYTGSASSQVVGASSYDGLAGTREIGLFPTGRILSTEYSVEDGRAAFGGTVTAGAHLRRHVAIQTGLGVAYSRQEFTYYRPPLFTFTPTLSLILQGSTANDFQPYGLAGVGYEFIRYTRPRCDCEQSRSFGIGNVGAGFRMMMGGRRALRAELSSQIGSGGPTFTGIAGMSFFIGGSPSLAPKSRPRPPQRVRVDPPSIPVPQRTQPATSPATPRTNPPAGVIRPSPPPAPPSAPPLTPAAGEDLLTLDGTQLDFSRPTWRTEAQSLLEGVVIYLTSAAGQGIRVSVEAHTDNIGSNSANRLVGLDRARAVREFLITQGITSDRIRISSAGEDNPVASNNTALGRQQNRRIVVRRDK